MQNCGRPSSFASLALRLLGTVTLLWAGLVIGISFLEAPVKFSAPSLTLPIGLDVGRHVFRALNEMEWALWIVSVVLIWTARPEPRVWLCLALAWSALFLHSVWLLPSLDAQAATIIAGGRPQDSTGLHVIYGLAEITKVIALIAVGWFSHHRDTIQRPARASRLRTLRPSVAHALLEIRETR